MSETLRDLAVRIVDLRKGPIWRALASAEDRAQSYANEEARLQALVTDLTADHQDIHDRYESWPEDVVPDDRYL